MKQITCPHCGDTYPDFDVAHVCSKGPYAPKLKPKMNERIRELALQAGYVPLEPRTFADDLEDIFLKKFAQLIVRECVRHFNEDYQRDFDTLWREDLSKSIKAHFGVEE